ncbi:MAG: DUF5723 family protein [Bacteroidales bacterium]
MKKILNIKTTIVVSLILLLGLSVQAQTLNGLYFLEGNNNRNNLNPAFTSESNYVSFPALGNVYIGVSTNVGMGAFLIPSGNELVTFLHESVSVEQALSNLKDNNMIESNIGLNIINVGFNSWGGSNSIALNVKSITGTTLPKELFTFLKTGQNSSGVANYIIPETSIFTNNYAELAIGHARNINDKLSVGAKVKALFGLASIEAQIQDMEINMTSNQWIIKQNAQITASKGFYYTTDENGNIDGFDIDGFGLGGFGLGLDLGAVYKINDAVTVSLAVTDLGFISWSDNNTAYNSSDEFTYDGFDNLGAEDSENGESTFDDDLDNTLDALESLVQFQEGEITNKTNSLYTTIRAAGEYAILNNKISFGLLGSMRLGAATTITEGMIIANFRPAKWFNASINGSVSNITSSMGAVINLHSNHGANFFVGMDYILATYSPQLIPIDSAKANINFGLSFNF